MNNFRTKAVYLRPLLVTIILVAVYRLGILVPLPFLDIERVKVQFGTSISYNIMDGQFSVFILGIMPYVSAYILVEIFSLCIPFLKKLRSKGYEGRLKLKRISLLLALGLAILQAIGIVSGLESWSMPDGKSILNISKTFEYVVLICVIVGCFYLLVVICELITKFGIGHGISIILLSGICGGFIERAGINFERFKFYLSSYFIALLIFCAFIYIALVLLKTRISIPCYHEKEKNTVYYFQLNLSPSSMAAVTFAASITMLPATLSYTWGIGRSIAENLIPGTFVYTLATFVCATTLSFLFGWAFLHPRRRVMKMQTRGWQLVTTEQSTERYLLKRQFIYNLPWTIFLCIIVVLPSVLISAANVPFYIGVSSIPVIVAISLDLVGSFKFYKNNLHRPVKIAEFHDVYDAKMIQNHMEALGIKSYLRGYHHRLLKYFFGPYLEMSLIVDDQDKEIAKTLIKDYYDGLGL